MKNVFIYPIVELLVIGSFILWCTSCMRCQEHEYECEITYVIDDQNVYQDTITISAPNGYVPAYDVGDGEITVDIYPTGSIFRRITVYKGVKDVKVVSFSYKETRQYYVSKWDGRELKPRKNK